MWCRGFRQDKGKVSLFMSAHCSAGMIFFFPLKTTTIIKDRENINKASSLQKTWLQGPQPGLAHPSCQRPALKSFNSCVLYRKWALRNSNNINSSNKNCIKPILLRKYIEMLKSLEMSGWRLPQCLKEQRWAAGFTHDSKEQASRIQCTLPLGTSSFHLFAFQLKAPCEISWPRK